MSNGASAALSYLAAGAANYCLVGAGVTSAPVWTAATGTGSPVLATSPTLVTPALGTPVSGVATNLTGTAAGLTAGNVTTNANLTGPITSVGNATSIAAQTGTGSIFVMNTSPTLVTPLLGTPTSGVLSGCSGYPGLAITAGKTITCTEDTSLDEAVAMSSKLTIPTAWTAATKTGDPVAEFTTPAPATWQWTVAVADIIAYAYSLVGKTMTLSFWLNTTTIAGTPSNTLLIKVPASKTIVGYSVNPCVCYNNSVAKAGIVAAEAGETYLKLYYDLTTAPNWTAESNTTNAKGQITFEVN